MDSMRFEDFFELWRSLKFVTIFRGRMRNLEKSTSAKEGLALARVALKDWNEIFKFQQDLINVQHFEAAYIFRKLQLDRAFHFTAMPKLLSYRMKTKIQRAEITEEFKDPNDCVMKLITSDVLEEMMNVHDHYQRMKHVISADRHQSQEGTVRSKLTSDSDSTPGQVQTKATRKRRNKEMLKPAESEVSFRARGDTQNIHKEEKSLSLSTPVVTEEDEENKSFSETEFTAPKRRRKQRTKI
ncbi:hypothetical protein Celaphus_00016662, partial [Cervus elaphus hippelaphus]